MLSTLSVNGTAAAVAVGEDAYTFAQPEENVTITATFEKRNEHTVTFDANGGSEPKDLPEEVTTAMPAKKVLHGSEYCLPEGASLLRPKESSSRRGKSVIRNML